MYECVGDLNMWRCSYYNMIHSLVCGKCLFCCSVVRFRLASRFRETVRKLPLGGC